MRGRLAAASALAALILFIVARVGAGASPQASASQLIAEAHDLRKQNTSEANRGAAAKLGEAAALFEASGDRRAAADALNELGEVQFSLGQVADARATFERQLPLRRAIGDARGEGDALNSLGVTVSTLGDRRRALEYYAQALPLLRAAGDRVNEAQTLSNTGVAHAMLNENREALRFFEQALPLRRAAGDRRGAQVPQPGRGCRQREFPRHPAFETTRDYASTRARPTVGSWTREAIHF